jgi:hypothetical protein
VALAAVALAAGAVALAAAAVALAAGAVALAAAAALAAAEEGAEESCHLHRSTGSCGRGSASA